MIDINKDGWIEWNGGECPVEPNTEVQVKLRNGKEYTYHAQGFHTGRWRHTDPIKPSGDIIAYKIVRSS